MRKTLGNFTAVLFLAALVFGLYGKLHMGFNQTFHSDGVQVALYYYDIFENRNYIMQNWYVPIDPFITTDLFVYLALAKLFGMVPFTLSLGAFVIFLSGVLALSVLVLRLFGAAEALVTAAGLMWAPEFASNILLQPYIHIGTIGFTFICLYILLEIFGAARRGRSAPGMHLALFVISSLTMFSDPYFLFVFTLPALVSFAMLRLTRTSFMGPRGEAALWLSLILAPALGMLLQAQAARLGLFILKSTSTRTMPLELMWPSFVHYVRSMFMLFDMDFASPGLEPMARLAGLVNFSLVALAGLGCIEAARQERDGIRRFAILYLVMLALVLSISYVLKERVLGDHIARYLTPMLYVFAVLLALAVSGRYERPAAFRALVVLLFMASAVGSGLGTLKPAAAQPKTEIAAFLKDNGLRYGYSLYFDAHVITFITGNEVKVRSVRYRDGKVIPHYLMSKPEWFEAGNFEGPTFLMVPEGQKEHGFDQITPVFVAGEFGQPQRTLSFGQYLIYVWPRNIADKIQW